MEIFEKGHLTASAPEAGALLYVTDCVSDSQESLEYACKLAEKHGVHVELLHVIDPERTPSSPDAHIGAQYSIETLARSLRTIKSNARALLLFGRPEDVIAKRAAAIKAILVAFQLDGSTRDSSKTTLAHRLNERCDCPVLTFSRFPKGGPIDTSSKDSSAMSESFDIACADSCSTKPKTFISLERALVR